MKTCKYGCKTDRLIKGCCPQHYQKYYERKQKLLSTTKSSKNKLTKAQIAVRAIKYKHRAREIQRWSIDKIIRYWEDIEI